MSGLNYTQHKCHLDLDNTAHFLNFSLGLFKIRITFYYVFFNLFLVDLNELQFLTFSSSLLKIFGNDTLGIFPSFSI